MSTPTILEKIITQKKIDVNERQEKISLAQVKEQAKTKQNLPQFVQAIEKQLANNKPAVIAEIKKASPSKGVLRQQFDPVAIAANYADNGAACLSILTDVHFFQGHDDYLKAVHQSCQLPILRKDFMIDPYQIYEAKVMGADCILLIAAVLDDRKLLELAQVASDINLDILVEVHDELELQRALPLTTKLIGINNRNLHTFETDLHTTINMLNQISDDRIVVTESGIHTVEHVHMMQKHDVHTFLVGEVFMKANNPGAALKTLFEL